MTDHFAIELVMRGDAEDVGVWSGTPAHIISSLRLKGFTVRAHNVGCPEFVIAGLAILIFIFRRPQRAAQRVSLRGAVALARWSLLAGWIESQRALRLGKRLSGAKLVVQIGGSFRFSVLSEAHIILEDMTIRQAQEFGWGGISRLEQRRVDRLIAQQLDQYRVADCCCFLSDWSAKSCLNDYGITATNVAIVGVGASMAGLPARRVANPPRYLFIGMDWERKNGDMVLRAFERLRFTFPDAALDLVGKHPVLLPEGVVGHGVLSQTNIDERATLARLFRQATVFVLPSLCEPAGIVFAESLSWGLPSICGSVGGAAWLVGDAGLTVDPHVEDELVAAMLALCDPDLYSTLAARAAERASWLTWAAVSERLVEASRRHTTDRDV
jgi:glycosyltransferase involved in cell wall biosynthesis